MSSLHLIRPADDITWKPSTKRNPPDDWRKRKFRRSIIKLLDVELAKHKIDRATDMEGDIFDVAHTKRQYLGYVGKMVMLMRDMIIITEDWLKEQFHEMLSKPPPRLRRVLSTDELEKYNRKYYKTVERIKKMAYVDEDGEESTSSTGTDSS